MKVAVFGAGALGGVYGVRLALRGNVDVSFVVRPARVDSTEPIIIEAVSGDRREKLEAPERTDHVPSDADVVLLTVGTEDLDALRDSLSASNAPIVVLTPNCASMQANSQPMIPPPSTTALRGNSARARNALLSTTWCWSVTAA